MVILLRQMDIIAVISGDRYSLYCFDNSVVGAAVGLKADGKTDLAFILEKL